MVVLPPSISSVGILIRSTMSLSVATTGLRSLTVNKQGIDPCLQSNSAWAKRECLVAPRFPKQGSEKSRYSPRSFRFLQSSQILYPLVPLRRCVAGMLFTAGHALLL